MPTSLEQFQRLLDEAHREVGTSTTQVIADHALLTLTGWTLNEARGRLMFADAQGRAAIMAAQAVALYEPRTRQFEWAWNDATFTGDLVRAVELVRAWGETNGLAMLADPVHTLDADMAAKLAAFTARFIGWPGVYRGVGAAKEIFLIFAPSTDPAGGNDHIAAAGVY